MCKTDDGVGSNDSLDDQDYLREGEYSVKEPKIKRNNSEDSEKMKELFNKMMTTHDQPYDIKNYKIFIEDYDEIEDLGLTSKANRKSHAELVKIRRNQKKSSFKNKSMQSDFNESVEVSERG
jgi:hypothetical protein